MPRTCERRPSQRLRPALPEEAIGGVADFPDPDGYIAGLTKAFDGNVYPFGPHQIAPGYPRPAIATVDEAVETDIQEVRPAA